MLQWDFISQLKKQHLEIIQVSEFQKLFTKLLDVNGLSQKENTDYANITDPELPGSCIMNYIKIRLYGKWSTGKYITHIPESCFPVATDQRAEDELMVIPNGLKNSLTTAAIPCTMIHYYLLNSSVINTDQRKQGSKAMLSIKKNSRIKLKSVS